MTRRLIALAMVALFGALAAGCPSVGVYRTARTLEPGISDLGITYSASRISTGESTYTDSEGNKITEDAASIVVPNLIPDVSFHVGVVDNLEVGGRLGLGSGLIELDAKWRILQAADDKLHLSIQPAVGYRALFFLEGVNITMPVLLTYDITRWFSVTAFGYGSYYNLDLVDQDAADDVNLDTNSLTAGGGLGFEFRGETFYVMPFVDRSLTNFGVDEHEADLDLTWVNFGVAFGFHFGKEKQQLDRIEDKIDRIDQKLN